MDLHMPKDVGSAGRENVFRTLVGLMLVAAHRQKKRVDMKVITFRLQEGLVTGEKDVEALRRYVLDGLDDEVPRIFRKGGQFSQYGDGRNHKRRLGE
jgi:hypothetical protein